MHSSPHMALANQPGAGISSSEFSTQHWSLYGTSQPAHTTVQTFATGTDMHAASMTQHKIPQVSQMSHTAIPQYSGIADHSTTQPPIYDGPSVLRSPVVSSSYTASASLQAFPTTSNDISSTGTPMTVAQSSTTNSTFPQSFHPSSAPHNTSFGPHFPQTSQNFTSAAQMLPNGAAYTQPCLPPTSLQSSFVPTGNPPNMTTFPQLYTTASKQNSPYVHSGQCEPLNVLPPPPAAQFIPPQPFQPHPQPNEVKHSIHPQYQSHSGSQLPRSGMYPGGMGSMQKEFTHVDTAAHNQQRRFVDLLQERNIRQCGGEDVSVTLPHTVANPDVHCDPNIFRCTLCAIPQTQELLEKSRLPFGLTLHPFRDMKNLHIISTSTIVRCRCCQTYINPYVYFPDDQHWKCNICYRVNDLPSDFLWDPSKKEFGEPTARPEIQYSTVEFIAPSEYMLRPPQPACYLFVLDVSQNAIENGYLYAFSKQLLNAIGLLPGDDRTLIGFIAFDTAVHFFQFFSDQPPKQLIVDDFSEPFLPVPSGLLVNLKKHIEVLRAFIESIPSVFECCSSTASCLGAAVTIAKELISDIGGRITVFQTVLPTLGPGSLHSREDPNQRAAEEVSDLGPATDFYKGLALECTYRQIAIDLFLLSSSYSDLSSIAEMARTSGGCIYYYPGYHINREQIQVRRFQRQLSRYFTRKIGFEAVLRIRCSRGLSLSSFHGNFFVRSTDLMALPNANPDSALGVQLQMDENLGGLSTASFQAALLYTSSKGDRRIRIHTLCLPITRDLPTIFTHFDVIAAVSLLSKMAVQRCMDGATLRDCREAMINAAVDAFGAYNAAISSSGKGTTMLAPTAPLRLFPLYILGMLKHRAFASGRSIKLDTRVADLLQFRSAPLDVIICEILPKIYCLNHFIENEDCPAELALSFQHINKGGIYLMNSGSYLYIYVSSSADPTIIEQLFGVKSFSYIDEDKAFESIDTTLNERVTKFIKGMHVHRSQFAVIVIIREDSALRDEFIRRLIEDRTESTHSYIEFLHHVRQEMMR